MNLSSSLLLVMIKTDHNDDIVFTFTLSLVFDGIVLVIMKFRRLYGNVVEFDGRTLLGYGRICTKWEIHKRVWWDGPIFFKYPSTDARESFELLPAFLNPTNTTRMHYLDLIIESPSLVVPFRLRFG